MIIQSGDSIKLGRIKIDFHSIISDAMEPVKQISDSEAVCRL